MPIRRTRNGFKLTGGDAREYVRQLGVKFDAEQAAVRERDQATPTTEGHRESVTSQEPTQLSEE